MNVQPQPSSATPPLNVLPKASVKPHEWRQLRAGRICDDCLTVQVQGEYDDTIECRGR